MTKASLLWVFVVTVLAVGLYSSSARAAEGKPHVALQVVGLDAHEADEHAEALTLALRARARASRGIHLVEDKPFNLGLLSLAVKCPKTPDGACLERIAKAINSDRFIWGIVSRRPGKQVEAEVHLWQRTGERDRVQRASYSENLTEANEESLERIAASLFDKLVEGLAPREQEPAAPVVVIENQEKKPLLTGRQVLGLSLMTLGVIGGIVGIAQATKYYDYKSKLEDYRAVSSISRQPNGKDDICSIGASGQQPESSLCASFDSAKTASTVGWIAGTAGVVLLTAGTIVFFTGDGSAPKQRSAKMGKLVIVPSFHRQGGGVFGVLSF